MIGPALAILVPVVIGLLILFLFVLYIIFKKRRRLLISIPLTVVLFGLLIFGTFTYKSCKSEEEKEAKKFLGDYKLERLDGQDCRHCSVRLTKNYKYEILRNGSVVGQGKWWLETAFDIPGPYLRIENGPKSVIWEDERTISYIDRQNHSE